MPGPSQESDQSCICVLEVSILSLLRFFDWMLELFNYNFLIVEWIKESLVEDSLQEGKIISFPFLNGYTDVLCIVGGINVQR
jgi:hypothetical protein